MECYNGGGATLGKVTFELTMDEKARANHERKRTEKWGIKNEKRERKKGENVRKEERER